MRAHSIAAIPGDGIGVETVSIARRVLDALAKRDIFDLHWSEHDWGCERYVRTGRMMPEDGLATLAGCDAILLGAVGAPGVPDHISLWGLLIPIRRSFEQYVSLRPARLLRGVTSPLAATAQTDVVVVRENCEGEYSEIGGRLFPGTPHELAVQEAVFTRRGVTRIARYAFQAARTRTGRVASATKSNGIRHTMPFWDEIVEEVAAEYPDVALTRYHADALTALLVHDPARFDVIVASNLFGDLLSDLTAALCGGLGIAPCANLDPTRVHPSMFEPVHGSAPDIAGTGRANPIGQLWAAAMMLDHLGERASARSLEAAIERAVGLGHVTPDLGGTLSTAQVGDAVLAGLAEGPADA
ncbi:MAG TPA: tartrate dehydrogenase [Solirubrobacteraceae bacterium]|jgi:tartrate dehydrogenase/decarboxylase/D-malate dehydrogenase